MKFTEYFENEMLLSVRNLSNISVNPLTRYSLWRSTSEFSQPITSGEPCQNVNSSEKLEHLLIGGIFFH